MSKKSASVAVLVAGALSLGMSSSAVAAVISGTISERVGVFPFDATFVGIPPARAFEVGDGTNHVTIHPSFGTYLPWEASLWFYGSRLDGGSHLWHDTDVAFVPGVTDVSLITDASAFSYTNATTADPVQATDFVPTMGAPEDWVSAPLGTLLFRNIDTGHYGAAIFRDSYGLIDGFQDEYGPFSAIIEIDWYFQTDGTGDFSTAPAPGSAMMLGIAGAFWARRRRG